MRGEAAEPEAIVSSITPAPRVPQDHPLRAIRPMADAALQALSAEFQRLHSDTDRPPIPPGQLLRASLLQRLYSVRSERLLMEELDYNLLFRWFVGLEMDDPIWDATTFTKTRDRLLEEGIAKLFLEHVVAQAHDQGLLADVHFTVDGTLLEACARPSNLPATTSLSILVPVYDEEYLVATSLGRLKLLEHSDRLSRIEVIVVDDGSTDRTADVLNRFAQEHEMCGGSKISWTFLRHPRNAGKGRAIQTALARATGEVAVIHDADLEYHPRDLLRILKVFEEEEADAVFGSRFAGGESRRVLMFRHQLGNKLLTFLCNLATNLNLTDIETGYKAVRTPLLRSIPLVSSDFCIEPELTIKLAKRRARLFEVPISYAGRTYEEGKKIRWQDGLAALWAIVRFSVSDDIYREDEYGSQILGRLGRAPRFNAWVADTIRPFCGRRVLEIGSGVGNLTEKLIPRAHYVASDINPLYLQTLASLRRDRPYLSVTFCDVTDLSSFPRTEGGYDTVICLNVLEHVADDRVALSNIKTALSEDGRAIILVPHGQGNFGTLDEVLGHKRRYSREGLRRLAVDCGLEVVEMIDFNRLGAVAWFLNGRILRRRAFGLAQILLLDILTPLLRRVDQMLPFPPVSLIAVMKAKSG